MKGRKKYKAPLTTRTRMVCGVVDFRNYEYYEVLDYQDSLRDCFVSMLGASEYALACHNQDFDENGEEETIHIHFAVVLKSVMRLSTFINKVASSLGVSPFAVSVDKMLSLSAQIRYFVHKDDPDKFQYNPAIIDTNLSPDEVNAILTAGAEESGLTPEYLYELVMVSHSKWEIMKVLGVYQYRNLRGVINDLWEERRFNRPNDSKGQHAEA